jgi:sugar-specific transcriptional regulator TrmB
MHELLRSVGLSEGEIKVYQALLDLGSSPLNKIHERVGIERRNIYDILNKLIERGLVTYITENKKRSYNLAHPSKLISYLQEKESALERTKHAVEAQLPTLLAQFSAVQPSINAEVYRGAEGMKAAWDDMLTGKDIHWIGAGRYMPKQYPHYFANWNKQRVKKKIKIHNILRFELKREISSPYELETMRFLPKDFSGNPTVIGIWGNKVGNFLFGKDLFVFVIESKDLAENYRRYHEYLWNNVAKP